MFISLDKGKAISVISNLSKNLPNVDAHELASDCVEFLSKSENFADRHLWRKMNQPAYLRWNAFCSQTELLSAVKIYKCSSENTAFGSIPCNNGENI